MGMPLGGLVCSVWRCVAAGWLVGRFGGVGCVGGVGAVQRGLGGVWRSLVAVKELLDLLVEDCGLGGEVPGDGDGGVL